LQKVYQKLEDFKYSFLNSTRVILNPSPFKSLKPSGSVDSSYDFIGTFMKHWHMWIDDFIGTFMKHWHMWIDELKEQSYCNHIVLDSGQYLMDVI